MATIVRRPGVVCDKFHAPAALIARFPHSGSGDVGIGDLIIQSSNLVQVGATNAADATVVGLGVQRKASVTANTRIPVTMLIPGHMYELSANADTVLTAAIVGLSRQNSDNSAGSFHEVDTDTAGAGCFNLLMFASWLDEEEVNRILGQSDTSETAGRFVQPGVSKGVVGDTSPRLIVTVSTVSSILVN